MAVLVAASQSCTFLPPFPPVRFPTPYNTTHHTLRAPVQDAEIGDGAGSDPLANFHTVGYLIDQERNVNAINAVLIWFKVFKYLQVIPQVRPGLVGWLAAWLALY